MNPNEYEVEILLRIKAQLDELVKVRKGMQGFKEDVEKSNKSAITGFKDMQNQLRSLITPITMVRRTVWQLGLTWALTGGTIVAAIADIRKKQEELNNISIKTGLSTETVSKQLYGFNIATTEAKAGVLALQEAQSGLNRMWTLTATAVTSTVGEIKIAARENEIFTQKVKDMDTELNRVRANKLKSYSDKYGKPSPFLFGGSSLYGAEQVKERNAMDLDTPIKVSGSEIQRMRKEAHEEAIKQINEERWKYNSAQTEAKILRGELNSKVLMYQGKELESFRTSMDAQLEVYRDLYGPKGDITTSFEQFYQMQEDRLKLAQFGLRDHYQIMADMQKQFGQSTTKLFGDVFIDAFDNKLSGAKEIFAGFLIELRNMFIRSGLEELVASLVGESGGFNWVGATVKSLFGAAGGAAGGATNTYNAGTTSPLTASETAGYSFGGNLSSYHTGGIVKAHSGLAVDEVPIIAQTGERVLSRSQNDEYEKGGGGSQTAVTYNINAIDAASFVQLVSRNPEIIVSITEKAIRRNQSMRKTIKDYT